MTTGVLGILNGVGSLTYTAPSNAKLRVQGIQSYNATTTFTINFAGVATTASLSGLGDIFIGTGQSVVITTGAGAAVVVSALEEL